jgi:hypothetical protein
MPQSKSQLSWDAATQVPRTHSQRPLAVSLYSPPPAFWGSTEMEGSKDSTGSEFQFVNITKPGVGWKNRNEHIVRSHVMRQVRREKRCQNSKLQKRKSKSPSMVLKDQESDDRGQRNLSPIYLQPSVHQLSPREARLLSHVSNLYSPLLTSLSQKFVIWTKGVKE